MVSTSDWWSEGLRFNSQLNCGVFSSPKLTSGLFLPTQSFMTSSHSVISDNCKLILNYYQQKKLVNQIWIKHNDSISNLTTNFLIRTRVNLRARSLRIEARGIFPGAEVVRGHDWRWGNQDGKWLCWSLFLGKQSQQIFHKLSLHYSLFAHLPAFLSFQMH